MSHYVNRYCATHGDWDMDSDHNSECPECERLGLTEVQQLRQQVSDLTTRLAAAEAQLRELEPQLAHLQTTTQHYDRDYVRTGEVESITQRACNLIAALSGSLAAAEEEREALLTSLRNVAAAIDTARAAQGGA